MEVPTPTNHRILTFPTPQGYNGQSASPERNIKKTRIQSDIYIKPSHNCFPREDIENL